MRVFSVLRTASILGAGLLFSATASSAASVTFDFASETTGHKRKLDYTQDATDLKIRALKTNRKGKVSKAKVAAVTGTGLGVKSGKQDNEFKIDSRAKQETVVFKFDSKVTIESITFSSFRKRADFGLKAGALDVLTADVARTYIFSDTFTSKRFSVTALEAWMEKQGVFKASSFNITGLTVRTPDTGSGSGQLGVVPLPAGGFLLLGALGMLGFARRRKRT